MLHLKLLIMLQSWVRRIILSFSHGWSRIWSFGVDRFDVSFSADFNNIRCKLSEIKLLEFVFRCKVADGNFVINIHLSAWQQFRFIILEHFNLKFLSFHFRLALKVSYDAPFGHEFAGV